MNTPTKAAMDAAELLPCPFCGGTAQVNRDRQMMMLTKLGEPITDDHYYFYVYHRCPSGLVNTAHGLRKAGAIAAWNTRAASQTAELLEALAHTRQLVANCAVNGFVDRDDIIALYENNGTLSRLLKNTQSNAAIAKAKGAQS